MFELNFFIMLKIRGIYFFVINSCSSQTILLPREENRSVRAENDTWDEFVVPELRRLALNVLVENWQEKPVIDELPNTVDRDTLLEKLPPDLPFDLIIEKIPHEYYWSRAVKARST